MNDHEKILAIRTILAFDAALAEPKNPFPGVCQDWCVLRGKDHTQRGCLRHNQRGTQGHDAKGRRAEEVDVKYHPWAGSGSRKVTRRKA